MQKWPYSKKHSGDWGLVCGFSLPSANSLRVAALGLTEQQFSFSWLFSCDGSDRFWAGGKDIQRQNMQRILSHIPVHSIQGSLKSQNGQMMPFSFTKKKKKHFAAEDLQCCCSNVQVKIYS